MSEAIKKVFKDYLDLSFDYVEIHQFVAFELSGVEVKADTIKHYINRNQIEDNPKSS